MGSRLWTLLTYVHTLAGYVLILPIEFRRGLLVFLSVCVYTQTIIYMQAGHHVDVSPVSLHNPLFFFFGFIIHDHILRKDAGPQQAIVNKSSIRRNFLRITKALVSKNKR